MSAPTHTPGPWLVHYERDAFDSAQSILKVTQGNTYSHPQGPLSLASVNVAAFAPHTDEALANAKLISAAPDLLAALDRLQAFPNDPRAHRQALDALTKARSYWTAKEDGE